MNNFWNSNTLIAIVTFVVAFAAYALYLKQRRDNRKESAGIIFRELDEANESLRNVQQMITDAEEKQLIDYVPLLKSDSWDSLKHTLSSVLPDDVISSIANFYSETRRLDASLEFISSAFYKNEAEVRVNQFRVTADFLKEYVEKYDFNEDNKTTHNKNLSEDYFNKRDRFVELHSNQASPYIPSKPIHDAKNRYNRIPKNLLETRVGDQLRRAQKGWPTRLINIFREKQKEI